MRNEKREKYKPLLATLRRKYRGWVDFVPAIIGATGAVTTDTVVSLRRLDIDLELPWLQAIAARATVNIFRSLL